VNEIRVENLHGGQQMSSLQDKLQEESTEEAGEDIEPTLDPRVGIPAAVVIAVLVAGAGFVTIRRRRRRSLMKRLQNALPELDKVTATLKRPLRRTINLV
jgi:hypothetical protein